MALALINLSISTLHWALPLRVLSNKMPRYLIEGEGVSLWPLSLVHELILSFCLGLLKMISSILVLVRLILLARSQETRCFRSAFICFWIFLGDFSYT